MTFEYGWSTSVCVARTDKGGRRAGGGRGTRGQHGAQPPPSWCDRYSTATHRGAPTAAPRPSRGQPHRILKPFHSNGNGISLRATTQHNPPKTVAMLTYMAGLAGQHPPVRHPLPLRHVDWPGDILQLQDIAARSGSGYQGEPCIMHHASGRTTPSISPFSSL